MLEGSPHLLHGLASSPQNRSKQGQCAESQSVFAARDCEALTAGSASASAPGSPPPATTPSAAAAPSSSCSSSAALSRRGSVSEKKGSVLENKGSDLEKKGSVLEKKGVVTAFSVSSLTLSTKGSV